MLSVAWIILIALLALLAPLVGRYSPTAANLAAFQEPPSLSHWLGTNSQGEDVWSLLVWGGRVTLVLCLASVALSTAVGILVGSVAGYYGGLIDGVLMRVVDGFLAFPQIVLLLMLAAVLGPSVLNVVLVIGLLNWMGIARIVRGELLSLRESNWVIAARSIGVPTPRLIVRHLLPHVLSLVAVNVTFAFGGAIFAEASLSFLGLGVPITTPSWGNMLAQAQNVLTLQKLPWVWLSPGLTVVLSVLAISYIGETIRKVWATGSSAL